LRLSGVQGRREGVIYGLIVYSLCHGMLYGHTMCLFMGRHDQVIYGLEIDRLRMYGDGVI